MHRNRISLTIATALGTLVLLGCSAFSPTSPVGDVVSPAGFALTLTSEAGESAGTLARESTCVGVGVSPALVWTGAPAETVEFAILMSTLPGDGTTKWNWVVYNIPRTTSRLAENSTGVGVVGTGSHGTTMAYDPPCSQGPGPKAYTLTLYALSASPVLPDDPRQVAGDVLAKAVSTITLATASLTLTYSRP